MKSVLTRVAGMVITPMLATAELNTLGPSEDLNQAVNFRSSQIIAWSGHPSNLSLVTFDPVKRQLVRLEIDLPSYSEITEVLMSDLPASGQILLGEIDNHPGADLILLAGQKGYVWSSGTRTLPNPDGPDIEFAIPSSTTGGLIKDFDMDGFDDLFLFGESHLTGYPPSTQHLIFSVGRPGSQLIQWAPPTYYPVQVAPPWRTSGPPTFVVRNFQTSDFWEFSPDRTPVLVNTAPGSGFAAELDGTAPPEWIRITTNTPAPDTLQVWHHTSEEWSIAASLASDSLTAQPFFTDFDLNGRQEMMFLKPEFDGSRNITLLNMLTCDSGPASAKITSLPSLLGNFHQINQLALPLGSPLMAASALNNPYNYPNQPYWTPGSTNHFLLRNNPLNKLNTQEWNPAPHASPDTLVTGNFYNDNLANIAIVGRNRRIHTFSHAQAGPRKFVPGNHFFTRQQTDLLSLDVDGDGLDDLLNHDGDSLRIIKTEIPSGATTPTFSLHSSFTLQPPASPSWKRFLGKGDFNGDGITDPLFLSGSGPPFGANETIYWYSMTSNGFGGQLHPISLAGRTWVTTDQPPFGDYQWISQPQTIISDLDGNGTSEFLTMPSALGNGMALHRNTSIGFSLEPAVPQPVNQPTYEFGLTSELPILAQGRFSGGTNQLQFAVLRPGYDLLGNPLGLLWIHTLGGTVPEPTFLPPVSKMIATDFDGDGFSDLILARGLFSDLFGNPSRDTDILLLRNRGDGTFDHPITIAKPIDFASSIISDDFNGDGLTDLVVTSTRVGTVELFLNQTVDRLPEYAEWAALHGLSHPAPLEDEDQDGLSNLLEYATGTRPDMPGGDSLAPTKPKIPDFTYQFELPTFEFPRPLMPHGRELVIDVETSNDLVNWRTFAGPPTITNDPSSPQWQTLRWIADPRGLVEHRPQWYFRFKVSLPPSP